MEVRQLDPALVVRPHFADVVTEATERLDAIGGDDLRAAPDADVPTANDPAVGHERAGDDRVLADPDDLANLCSTLDDLDDHRLKEALEGRIHIVGELVDDVVESNVDPLDLGGSTRGVGDLRAEADDDRIRGGGQHDVVVGDISGALEEDVESDLVLVQLLQCMRDRAEGAGDVRLEDDPEFLRLAGLDLLVEVLERGPATPLSTLGGRRGLARLDRRPGLLLVAHDAQDVAGLWDVRQTQDDDCRRGAGPGDPLALVILEGADASVRLADHDDVTDLECAGLDECRGDGAAALVQLRLDDRADGGSLRVRLELLEVGDEEDHLDQLVKADPCLRRDRNERHVAAILLDDDAGLGQLRLDSFCVGVGLVDLVEGDDDRHLGGLRMADRLQGLGHHPVVRRDDHDRDIGDFRAAGSHRGERLVARGVEEDDTLAVVGDLAGPDPLGDAATLARGHFRRPDGIEQARLAVVDVTHDGHDRRARQQERRIIFLVEDLLGRLGDLTLGFGVGAADPGRLGLRHLVAELAGDERRGVAVDELVDRGEDPALDELADDVRRVDPEELGEFLDGDRPGQLDRPTLAGIERLHARSIERTVATRWLAGPATAARAAPTPGHGLLLRWSSSCSGSSGSWPAHRAGRSGAGP